MGLFNVFKKKEVPQELPNLAVNEITANQSTQNTNVQQAQQHSSTVMQKLVAQPAAQNTTAQQSSQFKPLPTGQQTMQHTQAMQQAPQVIQMRQEDQQQQAQTEKGFFKDLMKELTQDIDSEKLDDVYKNKLLSEDIVNQIKGYWEKQKPELLLHTIGGNLKQRLVEKTDKLHSLEKEWQDAYSMLVTKEDQIRKEEKELKNMLSELMDLYESSLKEKKDDAKK